VAQAVKCLLCKCESLSSNSSPERHRKREEEGGRGRRKEGRKEERKEILTLLLGLPNTRLWGQGRAIISPSLVKKKKETHIAFYSYEGLKF
jgi:hypothetical protein